MTSWGPVDRRGATRSFFSANFPTYDVDPTAHVSVELEPEGARRLMETILEALEG